MIKRRVPKTIYTMFSFFIVIKKNYIAIKIIVNKDGIFSSQHL